MLAASTHLHRFEGRADFLTWASRIVINAALLHIRKSRLKPTVFWDQLDEEFERPLLGEWLGDPRPTPEQQLQRLELHEIFSRRSTSCRSKAAGRLSSASWRNFL